MAAEQKDSWLRKGDFPPGKDTVVENIAERDAIVYYNPVYPDLYGLAYGAMIVSTRTPDTTWRLSKDKSFWIDMLSGTISPALFNNNRIIYGGEFETNESDPNKYYLEATKWHIWQDTITEWVLPDGKNFTVSVTSAEGLYKYALPVLNNLGELEILMGEEAVNPHPPLNNVITSIGLPLILINSETSEIIYKNNFYSLRSENRKPITGKYTDNSINELRARPIPSAQLTKKYFDDNFPFSLELFYDDIYQEFRLIPHIDENIGNLILFPDVEKMEEYADNANNRRALGMMAGVQTDGKPVELELGFDQQYFPVYDNGEKIFYGKLSVQNYAAGTGQGFAAEEDDTSVPIVGGNYIVQYIRPDTTMIVRIDTEVVTYVNYSGLSLLQVTGQQYFLDNNEYFVVLVNYSSDDYSIVRPLLVRAADGIVVLELGSAEQYSGIAGRLRSPVDPNNANHYHIWLGTGVVVVNCVPGSEAIVATYPSSSYNYITSSTVCNGSLYAIVAYNKIAYFNLTTHTYGLHTETVRPTAVFYSLYNFNTPFLYIFVGFPSERQIWQYNLTFSRVNSWSAPNGGYSSAVDDVARKRFWYTFYQGTSSVFVGYLDIATGIAQSVGTDHTDYGANGEYLVITTDGLLVFAATRGTGYYKMHYFSAPINGETYRYYPDVNYYKLVKEDTWERIYDFTFHNNDIRYLGVNLRQGWGTYQILSYGTKQDPVRYLLDDSNYLAGGNHFAPTYTYHEALLFQEDYNNLLHTASPTTYSQALINAHPDKNLFRPNSTLSFAAALEIIPHENYEEYTTWAIHHRSTDHPDVIWYSILIPVSNNPNDGFNLRLVKFNIAANQIIATYDAPGIVNDFFTPNILHGSTIVETPDGKLVITGELDLFIFDLTTLTFSPTKYSIPYNGHGIFLGTVVQISKLTNGAYIASGNYIHYYGDNLVENQRGLTVKFNLSTLTFTDLFPMNNFATYAFNSTDNKYLVLPRWQNNPPFRYTDFLDTAGTVHYTTLDFTANQQDLVASGIYRGQLIYTIFSDRISIHDLDAGHLTVPTIIDLSIYITDTTLYRLKSAHVHGGYLYVLAIYLGNIPEEIGGYYLFKINTTTNAFELLYTFSCPGFFDNSITALRLTLNSHVYVQNNVIFFITSKACYAYNATTYDYITHIGGISLEFRQFHTNNKHDTYYIGTNVAIFFDNITGKYVEFDFNTNNFWFKPAFYINSITKNAPGFPSPSGVDITDYVAHRVNSYLDFVLSEIASGPSTGGDLLSTTANSVTSAFDLHYTGTNATKITFQDVSNRLALSTTAATTATLITLSPTIVHLQAVNNSSGEYTSLDLAETAFTIGGGAAFKGAAYNTAYLTWATASATATYNNYLLSVIMLKDALSTITSGTDFTDSTFRISDNTTPSKKVAFEVSGVTAATTRTVTIPDFDGTLAYLTTPVFVTNITAPIVYGSSASGGSLTLASTSHATKGKIFFGTNGTNVYDGVNDRFGFGIATPVTRLHVEDTGSAGASGYPSAAFGAVSTPATATNMYGIAISKAGLELLMIGINKNTATNGIPNGACYISTYNPTGTIAIGRGNSSGLPNLVDFFISSTGNIGIGSASTTARLHLPAGTTSAFSAPLKLTSGSLMLTPEIGAIEFIGDRYCGTITTGVARKEFTLNDTSLVITRIPFATTNGRLTDNANFVFDSTNNALGLGVTPTSVNSFFHVKTFTATALTQYVGYRAAMAFSPVSNVGSGYTAYSAVMTSNILSAQAVYNLNGAYGGAAIGISGASCTTAIGVVNIIDTEHTTGTATITNAINNYSIHINIAAGAAIMTNAYGYYAGLPKVYAGSITGTNLVGIYTEDFTASTSIELRSGVSYGSGTFTNKWAIFSAGGNSLLVGNTGFGLANSFTTSVSAKVHIGAGTATSSTAPLKFTSGLLLAAPEPGAVEYLTSTWYFTGSNSTRNVSIGQYSASGTSGVIFLGSATTTGQNLSNYTLLGDGSTTVLNAITGGSTSLSINNTNILTAITTGVGIKTAATSYLTLAAGTTSANTSPIKFTLGAAGTVLNTIPEAGALEAHNSAILWTDSSGYRREIALQDNLAKRTVYKFDFVYSSTEGISTQHTNGGTASSTAATVIGHNGITQLATGVATNGKASIGVDRGLWLSTGVNTLEYEFRIPTVSTGTDTFTDYWGFLDEMAGNPTNGCYFRYTDIVNGGKIQCINMAAGVTTGSVNDSGYTVVAGNWVKTKVICNGTTAFYYVNDTLVVTSNVNVPTATVGFSMNHIKSAGTLSRNLDMDYLYIDLNLTTAR